MEVNASQHRSDGLRDGSLAVAGWREDLHVMHYAHTEPEGSHLSIGLFRTLPTNAAVLDIRFGCEGWYPESYAPQPASTFVIAKAVPASH